MKHHHYLVYYISAIDIAQAFLTSFFLARLNWNDSNSFKKEFSFNILWALLIPPIPWVAAILELIKNIRNGEKLFAFSRSYRDRVYRIKQEKMQNKQGIKFSIMRFCLKFYT